MIGRGYTARVPVFTRSILNNEVLCRVSAPATGIVLVKRAVFGVTGADGLNQTEGVSLVRLSSDGIGGSVIVFLPDAVGDPAFGGTGAGLDAGGWSTQPTVSDTLIELTYNLAGRWEWAAQSEDSYKLIPTSARFGLRHIGDISDASPAVAYPSYVALELHEMD